MSFPDIRRRWLAQARLERFEDIEAALQAKRAQLEAEFTKALAGPDLAALGFRVAALRPQVELTAPDGTVIRFAEVGKYETRDAGGQWNRLGSARLRELTSGRVHGLQKLSDLAMRLGQLEQDLARLPDELAAFASEYRQRLDGLSQAVSPLEAQAAQQELDGFFAKHQEELPGCVEQELQKAKHQALLRGLFRPQPPAGVKASNDRSDGVLLLWEAAAGAAEYLVYRSEPDPAAKPMPTESVKAPKTELLYWHAKPGQELWFWVTAKNAAGESELSQQPVRGRRTEGGPARTEEPEAIPQSLMEEATRAADTGDVGLILGIYTRHAVWAGTWMGFLEEACQTLLGGVQLSLRSGPAAEETEALRAQLKPIQDGLARLRRLERDPARSARINRLSHRTDDCLEQLAELLDTHRHAEAAARAEAQAREQARLAAEAEARQLAQEKRIAEEKARVEAEARRMAEEKRLAEERQLAEEKARLAAEAETKRLTEEKRLAEERRLAEEKARLAAEAETKRLAEEMARREAEARRLAEERRTAEEQARAEAEARRRAEAKRLADEEARQEAQAREATRLAAGAEAKRLAEEKRTAEEQARTEAEAEVRRRAEAKRLAEEKARQEAEEQARRQAEERARQEAEARRARKAKAWREPAPKRRRRIWPVAAALAAIVVGLGVTLLIVLRDQFVPTLKTVVHGLFPPSLVAVTVNVAPTNAEIYVEGQRVTLDRQGVVQVKPGTNTIEARLAGYESETNIVIVQRGTPTRVDFGPLRPLPPVEVTVSVAPTNAEIFVDGQRVTLDREGVTMVQPGTRTIEARLAGYESKTNIIIIPPGAPTRVDFGTLRVLPVAVTVSVTPANADIYVDGHRVTLDRQGAAMVEPGARTIEARLVGHESKTTNVIVQSGTPTRVDLGALRVLPVAVTASVVPTNAEIYVDRQRVVLDRQGVVQVLPGTRTFEARLAGYETNATNLIIQPGTPARVHLGTLQPLPVAVTVTVVPAHAEIYVDSRRVTLDGQRVAQVQPGTRTFQARLAGYETNTTNVIVQIAMPTKVDLGALRRKVEPLTNVPAGFVWIRPGTFTMGSPANEQNRQKDEGPPTKVTLTKGFYLAGHEVKQAEYEELMGRNPSHFKGPNLPVENVSWEEATNYCAKLTDREITAGRLPAGWEYRLPTEAEWEYACRAGTTTVFHHENDLRSGMANFDGRGEYVAGRKGHTENTSGTYLAMTTNVESYRTNAWGLYDVHGNVWEWCLDWYTNKLSGVSVVDPSGPSGGTKRVCRGGSWNSHGQVCRCAYRNSQAPRDRNYAVGFRAALAPVR